MNNQPDVRRNVIDETIRILRKKVLHALSSLLYRLSEDTKEKSVLIDFAQKLLLIKPQGSVNWARNLGGMLSLLESPPSKYNSTSAPDPAIIPPSFLGVDRTTDFKWSGHLMRIATHAATQAKTVVAIGYSPPPRRLLCTC